MKSVFKLFTAFVLGTIFFGTATVMAGGDQNRGEIGKGATAQNNCENQPCFGDAQRPGRSAMVMMQSADKASEVNETERYHLQFIREEEKMARDVYRVLYGEWSNPIFANIVESEQAHMDAMANLIVFYGVDDSVTDDATGAFTNKDIAELYSLLVLQGEQSEDEALRVGANIEEHNILGLWRAYDETDNGRIRTVYQNLYEGSYNHLNAFVYVYELLTGEVYEPKLLSPDEYEYVMNFETQAIQAQKQKQQKNRKQRN